MFCSNDVYVSFTLWKKDNFYRYYREQLNKISLKKKNKSKDLNTTVPIRFVLLRHKIFRDV